MQLFYVPNLSNDQGHLPQDESRHAVKVLRLQIGDKIHLIDGKGGFFEAEITVPNPKACSIKILQQLEDPGKKEFKLHIAIAPTKNNDRMEWFLEKATEIGINRVTPLLCDRSERKIIKNERLERILVSAMKQSYKATLPHLDELERFEKFVSEIEIQQKYIAHCNTNDLPLLKSLYTKNEDVLILIGPEGDFTEKEVELAKHNGFKEISLGKSRLRTETAATVACHTINLINE